MIKANRNLTEAQWATLINALYTAAEKYRECARETEASDLPTTAKQRLTTTFAQQAADCSGLIELLEDCED